MPQRRDLLCLIREIRNGLHHDLSLKALAARAGWSRFHLHRAFREVVRETPKRYTLRLRLERAAARLIVTDEAVLDVALAAGFTSHEVFTRAFRRLFGCTPTHYRTSALAGAAPDVRSRHAALVDGVGPCIPLFHLPVRHSTRSFTMTTLSITREERTDQPTLAISRRIARHEIPAMLGECYGRIFVHCQKAGVAIAGRPFARYLTVGPGLWTIEAGMPVASATAGEGEIKASVLPGGGVALAIHAGSYEQLPETYAAIERWIETNGCRASGAPWESYITDPADHPNPADWRTEVYWPLAR